jgi:hypothetical protein
MVEHVERDLRNVEERDMKVGIDRDRENALSVPCFANYQIRKHGECTHALCVLTGENLRDVSRDAASSQDNKRNAAFPFAPSSP